MNATGINGHAESCKCVTCQSARTDFGGTEKDMGKYGMYKDFNSFVDQLIEEWEPKYAYKYPQFVVLDFIFTRDSIALGKYMKKRNDHWYPGIFYDVSSTEIVLIDLEKI
jgi:hypothetical protein